MYGPEAVISVVELYKKLQVFSPQSDDIEAYSVYALNSCDQLQV